MHCPRIPLAATAVAMLATAEVLYEMPASIDLFTPNVSVRIDDVKDKVDKHGKSIVSIWRIGEPDGGWLQPILPDLSQWTGLNPPDKDKASRQAGFHPTVPGTTAVQYSDGQLGVQLNLWDTKPVENPKNKIHLGSIAFEYNWGEGARPSPWINGGAIRCDVQVAFHSADKTGEAIYSTWALGIYHASSGNYVWYEMYLWDYQRQLHEGIAKDTIAGAGNKLIIKGYLGGESSGKRARRLAGDSAIAPWSGFQHFSFEITADHVSQAIKDGNAKYTLDFDTDAANWQLTHTNIQIEGTGEARAGATIKDMKILKSEAWGHKCPGGEYNWFR